MDTLFGLFLLVIGIGTFVLGIKVFLLTIVFIRGITKDINNPINSEHTESTMVSDTRNGELIIGKSYQRLVLINSF